MLKDSITMKYIEHQYILLFIFILCVYKIKLRQPQLFQTIERIGPMMYPGPVIQHVESIFSTLFHQFKLACSTL